MAPVFLYQQRSIETKSHNTNKAPSKQKKPLQNKKRPISKCLSAFFYHHLLYSLKNRQHSRFVSTMHHLLQLLLLLLCLLQQAFYLQHLHQV